MLQCIVLSSPEQKLPALKERLCDREIQWVVNDLESKFWLQKQLRQEQGGVIQGDQVLREIGTLFSASVRQGMDMIGRYAGDEFVLFLEAVDADTALSTVERLRKRIEQNRFQRVDEKGGGINGQYLHITASFGIAEHNPVSGIFDITQWISRADSALYRSKEKGGNIATVWKEPGEVIVP